MMQEKREDYFKNTIEALSAIREHFDKEQERLEIEYSRNEGIEIGLEQGKAEKRRLIKSLIELNVPIITIAQAAEISVEELEQMCFKD